MNRVDSYIPRFIGFFLITVLILIVSLCENYKTYAQDPSSQSSEQISSTQTNQESEEKEKGENSEKEQKENAKDEKSKGSDEKSDVKIEKAEEKSSEERDLLSIFEEMKKTSREELKKQREKQKLQHPERKPKLPTSEKPMDFVGPLPPEEKKNLEERDFIGPTLPDIRIPPIEEETFLELEFESANPPEGRKFIDFSADKIIRDKLTKTVKMEGNARLVYEDITILSEFAEFNEEEEWGKFWGKNGVLADNDDGIMKCDVLEASFKDKIAKAHGNIEVFVYGRKYEDKLEEDAPRKERLKRALGQDDTTIYCDEGEYNWGEKIFHGWVEKLDRVKIIQEGRHAYAKAIYHEKETELTILEGNVELWQKNGDWLFDRDVITDKDDKWANALLRPETTVTCDLIESRGKDEVVILEGNVLAVQKEKRGSADKVTFNDKEKIMIAEGNIKAHQDNGDWLILWKIVDPQKESEDTLKDLKKPADGQADKFTLWTEKKDFEAEGNIKAWQEHQELIADKVTYKKELDRLFIQGNVKLFRKDKENPQKKDDLKSQSLILWLTTKVYEAFGNVEAIKKIDLEEEREKFRKEKEKSKEESSAESK